VARLPPKRREGGSLATSATPTGKSRPRVPPRVPIPSYSVPMPAEPAIHVDALTYAYPGGPTALEWVGFSVAPGESIGLVGPNGAGKTTLFLCLSGVLPVKPGMARLAGLDPAVPAERRGLPARVGIVFQNSDDQLFNTTVFDDVAFGPLNLGLAPVEVRQ